MTQSAISISCQFDAGAIDVVSLSNPADIQLRLRPDNASEFAQWFYFRLNGVQELDCTLRFLNAGQAAYPEGWKDYHACASYDRVNWFRLAETRFDGQELTVRVRPECDTIYLAYFEPYSWERHLQLIGRAQLDERVKLQQLGLTVDGRDLDLLQVGDASEGKRKIWVTARQHPGETMAEWFMEGLIERLLDPQDSVARRLLEQAVFYLVPNMNPDGAVRGNLRTNAAGANLNREWQTPTLEKSPEVYWVRQKMHETGVDLFLDAHGDEGLPYNFVAGCEGNPGYSSRLANFETAFKSALAAHSPDFQDEFGYAKDAPGEANLTLATNYVGQTFDCLAYTLEMPFKDNANLPDADVGWNGERSRKLGAATLAAFLAVLPVIR